MNQPEQQYSHADLVPIMKSYPTISNTYDLSSNHIKNQKKYQYIGFKLLTAYTSVLLSQYLIANTLAKWIFGNIVRKRYLGSLFSSSAEEKKIWVNRQVRNLMKTMIRYNSIIFGTKVILDEYYSQTLKKNEAYYQSNSSLYYKIGALVGLITYSINIPMVQFQSIQNMGKLSSNFPVNTPQINNKLQKFNSNLKQFFSVQSLKRMMNNFSFASLMGVVVYRTIYFGGYEKIKQKYQNPVNEYLLAPIACSSMSLIVSPIDQIKYLQITTHKDKSFYDIILEKGVKLWNLPGQKIYTSIVKQSLSMSFFVAGQKLCNYFINMKNSAQQ